jgi:hypothetical protein
VKHINKFCGQNKFYYYKFTVCRFEAFTRMVMKSSIFWDTLSDYKVLYPTRHNSSNLQLVSDISKTSICIKMNTGNDSSSSSINFKHNFLNANSCSASQANPPFYGTHKILYYVLRSFSTMFNQASVLCLDLLYYVQKSPLLVSVLGQMNVVSFLHCISLRPSFIVSSGVCQHLPGGL